jgi:hypothetical protein
MVANLILRHSYEKKFSRLFSRFVCVCLQSANMIQKNLFSKMQNGYKNTEFDAEFESDEKSHAKTLLL